MFYIIKKWIVNSWSIKYNKYLLIKFKVYNESSFRISLIIGSMFCNKSRDRRVPSIFSLRSSRTKTKWFTDEQSRAFVISWPRSKRSLLNSASIGRTYPPKTIGRWPLSYSGGENFFSAAVCSETRKIVKNALNSRRFD